MTNNNDKSVAVFFLYPHIMSFFHRSLPTITEQTHAPSNVYILTDEEHKTEIEKALKVYHRLPSKVIVDVILTQEPIPTVYNILQANKFDYVHFMRNQDFIPYDFFEKSIAFLEKESNEYYLGSMSNVRICHENFIDQKFINLSYYTDIIKDDVVSYLDLLLESIPESSVFLLKYNNFLSALKQKYHTNFNWSELLLQLINQGDIGIVKELIANVSAYSSESN